MKKYIAIYLFLFLSIVSQASMISDLVRPAQGGIIDIGTITPISPTSVVIQKEWIEVKASIARIDALTTSALRDENETACLTDIRNVEVCPQEELDCGTNAEYSRGYSIKHTAEQNGCLNDEYVGSDNNCHSVPRGIHRVLALNEKVSGNNSLKKTMQVGSFRTNFDSLNITYSTLGACDDDAAIMKIKLNGKTLKELSCDAAFGSSLKDNGGNKGLGYHASSLSSMLNSDGNNILEITYDHQSSRSKSYDRVTIFVEKTRGVPDGTSIYPNKTYTESSEILYSRPIKKTTYFWYEYKCPTDKNKYDIGWEGPLVSSGADCGGCGSPNCSCNNKTPPANNCSRGSLACPADSTQQCAEVPADPSETRSDYEDNFIYSRGSSTKHDKTVTKEKECKKDDRYDSSLGKCVAKDTEYSCALKGYAYDKSLAKCIKKLECKSGIFDENGNCLYEPIVKCEKGYEFNAALGKCAKKSECVGGYSYDTTRKTCYKLTDDNNCPMGFTYSKEKLRCEKDLIYTDDLKCFDKASTYNKETKQCEASKNLNLSEWNRFGDDASWDFSAAGDYGTQNTNTEEPTLLLHPEEFGKDWMLIGKIKVTKPTGGEWVDNDWIGLTFGYKNNSDFYTLDWKKEDQGAAKKGLRFSHYKTMKDAVSWNSSSTNGIDILESDYAYNGWEFGKTYDIAVKSSDGIITAYIDNEEVLSYEDPDLDTSGKLGFFGDSQQYVTYSDFRVYSSPKCPDDMETWSPGVDICYQDDTSGEIDLINKKVYTDPICFNGFFNKDTKRCENSSFCNKDKTDLKCISGYTYSSDKLMCEKGDSKEPEVSCKEGYNYNNSTKKCEKRFEKDPTYLCSEGFSLNQNNICEKLLFEDYTPICTDDFDYNAQTKRCEKTLTEDMIPICPDTYTLNKSKRICEKTLIDDYDHVCPSSGFTYVSAHNRCEKFVSMDFVKSCESPYTYNSSSDKCEKILTMTPERHCNEGYSYDSGLQKCKKKVYDSPSYRCDQPGYSYSSSSKKCEKIVRKDPDYKCDTPYTMKNGKCVKRVYEEGDKICPSPYRYNAEKDKCEEFSGKSSKCNPGYTMKNGTCQKIVHKDYNLECPSNYTWNGSNNRCEKTISANPNSWGCPSGYTYIDDDVYGGFLNQKCARLKPIVYTCENPSSTYNASKKKCEHVVAKDASKKCDPGYDLDGDKCKKVTKTDPNISCSGDYTYNSSTKKCEKTSSSDASISCPAGWDTYSDSSKMCLKTTDYTLKCKKGKYWDSDFKKCVSGTSTRSASFDCSERKGEITNALIRKYGKGNVGYIKETKECCRASYEACKSSYSVFTSSGWVEESHHHSADVWYCGPGKIFRPSSNGIRYPTCKSAYSPEDKIKVCPTDYTYDSSSDSCIYKIEKDPIYTCSEGSLSGTKCNKTESKDPSITCSQGTLKNGKCEKTETKDVNYYCPDSSYSLSGTKCKKTVTDGAASINSNCPYSGYWDLMNGSKYGGNCFKVDDYKDRVPQCSSGWTAGSDYCYSTATTGRQITCDPGYSYDSSSKDCKKTVTDNTVYYCPYPYAERDGKCVKNASSNYFYQCNTGDGYSLSSDNKTCYKDLYTSKTPYCANSDYSYNSSKQKCEKTLFDDRIGYCSDSSYSYNNSGDTCEKFVYQNYIPNCLADYSYDSNDEICKKTARIDYTPTCAKAGFKYNAVSKKCERTYKEDYVPTCDEGYSYNAAYDRCEKYMATDFDPTCPTEGFSYVEENDRCEQFLTKAFEYGCKEGFQYVSENDRCEKDELKDPTLSCTDNYVMEQSMCVKIDQKLPMLSCLEGNTINPVNGMCENKEYIFAQSNLISQTSWMCERDGEMSCKDNDSLMINNTSLINTSKVCQMSKSCGEGTVISLGDNISACSTGKMAICKDWETRSSDKQQCLYDPLCKKGYYSTPDGKCTLKYTWYQYKCPSGWEGPFKPGFDCQGNCGTYGCKCNPSTPLPNNCRKSFSFTYDKEVVLKSKLIDHNITTIIK